MAPLAPRRPDVSGSSPGPGITAWLERLRQGPFQKKLAPKPVDPLRSAGQVLREAREAKGLGLRDLAQQTRISIAVLEALEGGWKDRLPEATYLRAMLPLLEQHLDLPTGSLEPILPHAGLRPRSIGLRSGPGAPFSPSTLALLTSWQSTLLYGLLLLGVLYGVNLQQQRLAAMGRLTANPIPLAPTPSGPAAGEPALAFPDLQPLARAAKGQAMDLLSRDSKNGGPDLSLGLLQLSLSQPTQVELSSQRGGRTQLQGLEGELSIPVLPPFELRLNPAPAPAAVRWKGQVVPGTSGTPSGQQPVGKTRTAVYAIPPPPAPKPTPSTPPKTP